MISNRPWGRMQGAIELTDGGAHVGYARLTSTSTILVYSEPVTRLLRTFDVGSGALELAFDGFNVTANLSDNPPATAVSPPPDEEWLSYICFLDSDSNLDFAVDTTTTHPTTLTNISNVKYADDWRYEQVDSFELFTPDSFRAVTTQTRDAMLAFYKDPCVVEAPAAIGGGYFMILVRGRVLASHLAGHYYRSTVAPAGTTSTTEPAPTPPTPGELVQYLTDHKTFGNAIFDIVCYYSPNDPAFGDGNTYGPYLLVHSMDALSDPHVRQLGYSSNSVAFRCALGVPAAAFSGGDLYLYYVAQAVPDAETASWQGANTDLDRVIAEYDDDRALRLFFALRPGGEGMIDCSDNLLYGIWRAAGVPAGEELDHGCRRVVAEPGRDFVVSFQDPNTRDYRDQLDWCRTDGAYAYDFMDPDAVRIDSRVRAYCYDYYELVYYGAAEDKGLAPWEDAWKRADWDQDIDEPRLKKPEVRGG